MASDSEPMPSLVLPPSPHVVDVSIIDTTARIRVPLGFFVENPLPGHEMLECPSFAFLVKHPAGKNILFDLGLRKDKESFPPIIRDGMADLTMDVEKDVATILEEDGHVPPSAIESIIWSHWHCDHSGDPSTFPSEVELVVGPGFKNALLPGYPADPNGVILQSDYVGRQLREIDFETGLKIGQFRAMDFFGDGSFYLLDAPGHAIGHMCGLARTTPTTFIFMGGDGCHHCGSLRPNNHIGLPERISPSPFSTPPHLPGTYCPGVLLKAIHPNHNTMEPFYSRLSDAPGRDVNEAEEVIGNMIPFDACENVFMIIAHDRSLLGVVDTFPGNVNNWKEKGWKDICYWRYLEDFQASLAPHIADNEAFPRQI